MKFRMLIVAVLVLRFLMTGNIKAANYKSFLAFLYKNVYQRMAILKMADHRGHRKNAKKIHNLRTVEVAGSMRKFQKEESSKTERERVRMQCSTERN